MTISLMSLESALPVIVDGDLSKYTGKKIRIAARLLGYDHSTGIALLANKSFGILVDPSLCMDLLEKDHWARQVKMPIVVMGNLELSTELLNIPGIPKYADEPVVKRELLLRAILLQHHPTLDLNLWNMAIYARQQLFQMHRKVS